MRLTVNGRNHDVDAAPDTALLYVLRNDLELNGPKHGCGLGECGACTVLIDDKPRLSCLTLATGIAGRRVDTVESLGTDGQLSAVQRGFHEKLGAQCGYCTPGFVMAAKGFLDKHPHPTLEQCEKGLSGNLCRCGTYVGMKKAVMEAAGKMKGGSHA